VKGPLDSRPVRVTRKQHLPPRRAFHEAGKASAASALDALAFRSTNAAEPHPIAPIKTAAHAYFGASRLFAED